MLILPGWTKEPCHSNSSKQASQLWSFKWNQWATLSHSHCRINWAENQETYMTPVINSPWKETHTLSNESCRWNKASSSRNTSKIRKSISLWFQCNMVYRKEGKHCKKNSGDKSGAVPYSRQPHARYAPNFPLHSQNNFYASTYKLHRRQPDHAEEVAWWSENTVMLRSCIKGILWFTKCKCGNHKKEKSKMQKYKLQNQSCFRPASQDVQFGVPTKKCYTNHLQANN